MADRLTRDRLFDWYNAYAFSFAQDGKLLPAMKKLKYDHSLRVAQTAKMIASDEGWDTTEVILGELCGIFHDVGRYRQYRDYKTFRDHVSVNHADLGVQILEETDCLAPLTQEERQIVIEATRMHNRKELPEGLEPHLLRHALLVRDADKLDIYHVLHDAITNDRLRDYPELLHDVDLNGAPNPVVVNEVLRRERVEYSDLHSMADFLLILMQWIYEFSFDASYRLLKRRGVFFKLQAMLPQTPEIAQIVRDTTAYLHERTGE